MSGSGRHIHAVIPVLLILTTSVVVLHRYRYLVQNESTELLRESEPNLTSGASTLPQRRVNLHGKSRGTLRGANSLRGTDKQIIFVHVPRSGGRSIECTFGRYKFRLSAPFQHDQRLVLQTAKHSIGLCCGGHSSLPELADIFEGVFDTKHFAVMMRDPAFRILSALRHDVSQRLPVHLRVNGNTAAAIKTGTLTVTQYVAAPRNEKILNHAVAMLSGNGRGTTDPHDLEIAKRRIVDYHMLIGIFERYADSMLLWQREMGTEFHDMLSCTNTYNLLANYSVQFKNETILTEIRRQHSLDTELYNYVHRLFESRFVKKVTPHHDPRTRSTVLDCGGHLKRCLSTENHRLVRPNTSFGRGNTEIVCWTKCNLKSLIEKKQ